MGKRKITIRQSAAESIAKISWFIESKGMIAAAEDFSNSVYDTIEKLGDQRISHAPCREKDRKMMGLKCKTFKKKYTIVVFESYDEIIVQEVLPTKLIR